MRRAIHPFRFLRRHPGLVRLFAYACAGAAVIAALAWYRSLGDPSRPRTVHEPVALPAGFSPPNVRPTGTVRFEDGCTTSGCHARVVENVHVHEPVARSRCVDCHQADIGGHRYPVYENLSQRCAGCHAIGSHRPSPHTERADIACDACHTPHSSAARPLLAAASVSSLCVRCHAESHETSVHTTKTDARCELCHDAHASKVRADLHAGIAKDSCAGCHDETLSVEPSTSPALTRPAHRDIPGQCAACHREHGSTTMAALRDEPANTCLRCHTDVAEALARASAGDAIHRADAEVMHARCLECHDPHSGERANMLRADEPTLCLKCHAQEIQRADGTRVASAAGARSGVFLHGPLQHARCAACHAGHGGRHTVSVITPTSIALAASAGLDAAVAGGQLPPLPPDSERCLACHDRALTSDDGERATGFRNDTTNLHKLHIRKGDRVRGCETCHAPHSASNRRLIAEVVAFDGSDWNMKLNYSMTRDGGTCAPGCHAPLGYARGTPASPLSAPAGAGPTPQGGAQ